MLVPFSDEKDIVREGYKVEIDAGDYFFDKGILKVTGVDRARLKLGDTLKPTKPKIDVFSYSAAKVERSADKKKALVFLYEDKK